jgi:hypothetical protein
MTEEEAKTKMCFRAATFGASQQLADGPGPHCIGSACMAWRNFPPEEWGKAEPPYHPSNVGIQPTDGYCGLAGKP